MRPCVIYARVSSKEQEREGFSIPAQLELLRDYAKRHGLTVQGQYTEAETAKQSGRPQFAALIKSLKGTKTPTTILVEKTDRLYRNFKDFLAIDDLIQSTGHEVHLVKEGETIGQAASSHTKFIHGIKVLLAKNYIDNLSEEVRKGQRQKAMSGGWHALAPYGYTNDTRSKTIVPSPEQAPFVIRAFQLYATGLYSLDTTVEHLYSEGFFYKSASPRIRRSRLHAMLTNPAYIGQVSFNGEIYDGSHAPLIDLATWLKVRQALRKDSKPTSMGKRDFLYRGLVNCQECSGQLVGEIKKEKYTYYRCHTKGCSQKYIKQAVLDDAVASAFHHIQFPEDAREKILAMAKVQMDLLNATANEESDRIHAQRKRLKAKRRTVYDDKASGIIDIDLWQEITKEIDEQLLILDANEQAITQADDNYFETLTLALELPEALSTRWSYAKMAEKQEILKFVTSNFLALDGNAVITLIPAISILSDLTACVEKRGGRDNLRTFLALHSATIRQLHKALSA